MKTKVTTKELLPNKNHVSSARKVIRAIYHEKRQAILGYVIAHPYCNINAIYKELGFEQSVTSGFLHDLEKVHIVSLQNNGRYVQVNVNEERLANVYRWTGELYALMLQYVEEPQNTITKKVASDYLQVKNVKIHEIGIRSVANILPVLDNLLHRKILHLLLANEEIAVTQLYIKLKTDQSVVSNYLYRLRTLELVCARREGKHMYYQANKVYIQALTSFLQKSEV